MAKYFAHTEVRSTLLFLVRTEGGFILRLINILLKTLNIYVLFPRPTHHSRVPLAGLSPSLESIDEILELDRFVEIPHDVGAHKPHLPAMSTCYTLRLANLA